MADPVRHQVEVKVRLRPEELAVLDRLRGLVPRNTWVRGLIRDAGVAADALEVSVERSVAPLRPVPKRRVLGLVGENGQLAPARYAREGVA